MFGNACLNRKLREVLERERGLTGDVLQREGDRWGMGDPNVTGGCGF